MTFEPIKESCKCKHCLCTVLYKHCNRLWFLLKETHYQMHIPSLYTTCIRLYTCLSTICAQHRNSRWKNSTLLTEPFCNFCDLPGFMRISLAVIFRCTLETCVITEEHALLNTIWQIIFANQLKKIKQTKNKKNSISFTPSNFWNSEQDKGTYKQRLYGIPN